jgi:hypothetical protein
LFAGRTAGTDKASTDLRGIEEKQPVIGKPVGTKVAKTTKTTAKSKAKTAVKVKTKKAAKKKA